VMPTYGLYKCYAPGGGTMMASLRTYAEQQIDSSWHHSWHWPDTDWEKQALKDAYTELDYANKRKAQLEDIIKKLKDGIEDD
jgi:protein-disulfide isomerase